MTETESAVYCRHCGETFDGEDGDFLCPSCGRYQDSMQCPTCNQPVRLSLMPAETHPEVHAPVEKENP